MVSVISSDNLGTLPFLSSPPLPLTCPSPSPVHASVGKEATAEYSSLDTGLLGTPGKLNGQISSWLYVKFQIEAYFGVCGCLELLHTYEAAVNPMILSSLPNDTWKVQLCHTYFFLVGSTSEAASYLVRSLINHTRPMGLFLASSMKTAIHLGPN